MLLKRLRKLTVPDSEEYEKIEKAVDLYERVTEFNNASMGAGD
jgi:hypothetical protein